MQVMVKDTGARDHTRFMALGMILVFWLISVANLDRFPPIQADEPWILSPGFKFFAKGIFGSDLFASFYGMDQHYFEFLPLMSLLQGLSVHLLGIGVWQLRFVPIALGTLTLALTFALARRLSIPLVGVIALLLLLVWQWTPSGANRILGSGTPLIDVSRIARYDILVAPLGLGALLSFIHAREKGKVIYDFLSGLLAGLAGLAHLYGLFWAIALLLTLLVDRLYFSHRPIRRGAALILLGVFAVWFTWIGLIILSWNDFQAQVLVYSDRLDLLNPSFYLDNLWNERHRYSVGIQNPTTFTRVGFWLLIFGVPTAMLWVSQRVMRQRDRRALWLLVPSMVFPILFALLVKFKLYNYLVGMVPLMAILVAWCLTWLLQSQKLTRRTATIILIALLTLQGAWGIVQMQLTAVQISPPSQFLAELRETVPPSARVIGINQYWLAFTDRDYRSWVLPLYLSTPSNPHPISFQAAMNHVAPQIVLLDVGMAQILADRSSSDSTIQSDPIRDIMSGHSAGEQFWDFMGMHRARLISEVHDHYGALIQIYQLDP